MGAQIYLQETLQVGDGVVWECFSPNRRYGVIFEDDGSSAHFHGLDNEFDGAPCVDSLFVYDVSGVEDRRLPAELKIVWSDDGDKAALLINDFAHAVFDFAARRGYCRTNRPRANRAWTQFDHVWDDLVQDLFA